MPLGLLQILRKWSRILNWYPLFFAFNLSGCGVLDLELPTTINSPSLPPIILSVEKTYPTNSNWNDYVRNNNGGTTENNQPDVACAGYQTGCIHGGEKRKIGVTGYNSCSGLSAADNHAVFVWSCEVTAGLATFYSSGFNVGKGLSNLINANSFKEIQVTVSSGSTVIGQSISEVWWTNPIFPLPDNSAGSKIDIDNVDDDGGTPGDGSDEVYTAGSILVLPTSRTSSGYFVNLDKIAIVTLPGATLNYNGNAAVNCNGGDQCLIYVPGSKYTWIEGSFDGLAGGGSDSDFGVFFISAEVFRVHNAQIKNHINIGLRLASIAEAYVTASELSGNGFNGGLSLSGSTHHSTFRNLLVKDNSYGIVCWMGPNNLTFENSIIKNSDAWGFYFVGCDNNKFRNISVSNSGNTGGGGTNFVLADSDNNQLFDIIATGLVGSGHGIELCGTSTGNTLSRINVSNNDSCGLYISPTATNNYVSLLTSQNNRACGVHLDSADDNILTNLTLVNNADPLYYGGMRISNGANRNTISNAISSNNTNGILFTGASASANNTLSQIITTDNEIYGVNLDNLSNSTKFSGQLIVGNNPTKNCAMAGGTNPGLSDTTCTTSGVDGSVSFASGDLSNATLRIQKSVAQSFVGKLLTGDITNTSDDASGGTTFPADPNLFDWGFFENLFRAWGLDGSAFPSASNRGQWQGGSGRIWDLRLSTSDPYFLGKTGDGENLNSTFIPNANCPTSVHGNQTATDQQTSPHTYLLNAVEIVDPSFTGYSGAGNHNGLCESNESCLYTPNFGAYQGQGTLSTCIFTDGTVSGITIYGYGENGINQNSTLNYGASRIYLIGESVSLSPSATNVNGNFSVFPPLPAGLSIDASTGVISGTPSATVAATEYIISAKAGLGSIATKLNLRTGPGFRVNSLADTSDSNVGNGVCLTAGGVCTLRAAAQEANALGGATNRMILLPSGQITLSGTANISILSNIEVIGASNTASIIDGNAGVANYSSTHIFFVNNNNTLTLSDLTLQNAKAPVGESGGAMLILNSNLIAQRVIVQNNVAGGSWGGGGGFMAYADSGGSYVIDIKNSSFINNSVPAAATTSGGAISTSINASTLSLTVTNSLFSNNAAPAGSAGAIHHGGTSFTVTNSLFTNNTALSGGTGGAIDSQGAAPAPIIQNSTFIGNNADGCAGAIGGQGVVTNSTFVNNNVNAAFGGGVFGNCHGSLDPISFKNSIFLNNTRNSLPHNCGDTWGAVSLGNNIFNSAVATECFNFTQPGDQQSTSALLGPLQNNGGPTQTMELLTGSPGVDQGNNSGCPATDQRGKARPMGGTCDVGAFER